MRKRMYIKQEDPTKLYSSNSQLNSKGPGLVQCTLDNVYSYTVQVLLIKYKLFTCCTRCTAYRLFICEKMCDNSHLYKFP